MIRALPILLVLAVTLAAWGLIRIARRARAGGVDAAAVVVSSEEQAPATVELPDREPFAVEPHLMNGNGFPILDWHALGDWARGDEGVSLGRRAWLLHLRDVMGDAAELVETRDAWVLSTYEANVAHAVAGYVGRTRGRIKSLLADVAHFAPGERSIFVAFETRDDYYHYVANYYPEEGEFALSGGMYVHFGCPHFVTPKQELWALEPVIAHELTHSALAHLELPLWLNEGIAVTTERNIAVSHENARNVVELIGRHLTFWNAERMQEFWSGASFHRTDDGNELSYDLARNIVGLIGREWPSFARFARAASYRDGGAAAAAAELQLDLGELAAAALNVAPQKSWSPDPKQWKSEGLRR